MGAHRLLKGGRRALWDKNLANKRAKGYAYTVLDDARSDVPEADADNTSTTDAQCRIFYQ